MAPRKPRRQRPVVLSRRRVLATVLAIPGLALATVGIGLVLTAPEALPRESSRHAQPRGLTGRDARPDHRALTALTSPSSSVAAVATSSTGLAASTGPLAPTPEPGSPAALVLLAEQPSGVSAVESATWLQSAVLDPQGPDSDDRVLVIGRVADNSPEGRKPTPDARVTLWASFPAGGDPLDDDTKAHLLLGVAPELRRAQSNALDANPRQQILEVTSGATGRDGRFQFAVDRSRLPPEATLFATAWRQDGEGRLAGAADPAGLPPVDDSADRVERAVVSLNGIVLARTLNVVAVVTCSGAGVSNARVKLGNSGNNPDLVGTTDGSGRFEAEVFAGYCLRFSVSREGFSREAVTGSPDGKTYSVELGAPARLAVRVVGPDGAAVPGSQVSADSGGGAVAEAVTDSAGRATLEGLTSGHTYSISAGGVEAGPTPLERASVSATVPSEEVTVELAPAGAIDVDLSFEAGLSRPIATGEQEVQVTLETLREDGTWETNRGSATRERSRRFGGLAAGTYRLTLGDFSDNQHMQLSFTPPIEVKLGAPVRTSLDVGHGRSVTGWVTDEKGAPLDAEISFQETSVKPSTSAGWLDLRLPATTVHMTLKANGRQDRQLTITPDQTWLGEMSLLPSVEDPSAN